MIGTMSALLNVAMAAAAWWEGAPARNSNKEYFLI
jgi:hypothetical protein